MRFVTIAGVAVLIGCHARPRDTPAPATPDVACAVPVHQPDSAGWREVHAAGFSFCVPPGWRPSGERGWRGEAGRVTWDTGSVQRVAMRTTIGVTRVPGGIERSAPISHRANEVIGGALAALWDTELQNSRYTGASWEGKRVYFEGEASGPRNADRQWAIYRTVHFTTVQ